MSSRTADPNVPRNWYNWPVFRLSRCCLNREYTMTCAFLAPLFTRTGPVGRVISGPSGHAARWFEWRNLEFYLGKGISMLRIARSAFAPQSPLPPPCPHLVVGTFAAFAWQPPALAPRLAPRTRHHQVQIQRDPFRGRFPDPHAPVPIPHLICREQDRFLSRA